MFIGQPIFPVYLNTQAADSDVSRHITGIPFLKDPLSISSGLNISNKTNIAKGISDNTLANNTTGSIDGAETGNKNLAIQGSVPDLNKLPLEQDYSGSLTEITDTKEKTIDSDSGYSSLKLNLPEQDFFNKTKKTGVSENKDPEKESPVQKAVITNFTYQFTKDVVPTDLSGMTISDNGGVMIMDDHFEIGDILVDKNLDTAIKIIGNNNGGGRVVRQAEISEVFEKFDLPQQNVTLLKDNYEINPELKPFLDDGTGGSPAPGLLNTLIATNAGESDRTAKDKVNKIINNDLQWSINFQSPELVTGTDDNGGTVKVKLKGKIGLKPILNVKYTFFDGYRLGFGGAEQFDITAKVIGDINKRVYIPLYAIDVPIVEIGAIRAGVFLVIDVDGKFTVVVKAEQGAHFTLAITGDTFLGVPTSLKYETDSGAYATSSFDPEGELKVDVLIALHLEFSLLGCDVFMGELAGGVSGYASVLEDKSRMKFGMNFVISCYLEVLGEGGWVLSKSWNIFSQENTTPSRYTFITSELDANSDTIKGKVFKVKDNEKSFNDDSLEDPFSTKDIYTNGSVRIEYWPANGPMVPIDVPTDDFGIFSYTFSPSIDIKKGDAVVLSVEDSRSERIESTFPFKRIVLTQAEFFEDTVIGYVEPAQPLSIPGVNLARDENSLIHYSGPVKILVQKDGQTNEYGLPNITLDKFQGPVLGPEGDPKIIPESIVQAVASKDGFDIVSQPLPAQNPIQFKKWHKSNIEVPAGPSLYLSFPMIKHMENHYWTLNTNPIGTKPCTEPIDISIRMGKVDPKLNMNEVHKMSGCYKNKLQYYGPDYYERNGNAALPSVLFEFSEKSEMKNEWATDSGNSPLVAGTNVYWAYEITGPERIISLPDKTDLINVKRMKPISDTMKGFKKLEDISVDKPVEPLKLDPSHLEDLYKPRVGSVIPTSEILEITMPEYTYNAPEKIWDLQYFDDESRIQTTAVYTFEGSQFWASYLYDQPLLDICPPDEKKDGSAVLREVQKAIERIKNHDYKGLWLEYNQALINPNDGGFYMPSVSGENLISGVNLKKVATKEIQNSIDKSVAS